MSKGKSKKAQVMPASARQEDVTSVEEEVTAAIDAATPTARREAKAAAAARAHDPAETPDEKPKRQWYQVDVRGWETTEEGDLIIAADPEKSAATQNDKESRRRMHRRQEKLRKRYGLERMNEYKEPPAISTGARIWTIVEMCALSAVWVFAFNILNERTGELVVLVALAMLFFGSLVAMLITRAYLESKRRYDVKPSTKTVHYYLQMLHYDVKLWGLITFGLYATMWFVEHLLPISGVAMDALYVACAAYLGYIWTIKYKGVESVPYGYMETVYLIVMMFSNYIVLFLLH